MNKALLKKYKKQIIICLVFITPFLLYGITKAYVGYKEATIDDRSIELFGYIEEAKPIREDSTKRCSETYQGFSPPTGYTCNYSSERYFDGAPNVEEVVKKLEQKNLKIIRVNQGSLNKKYVNIRAKSEDGKLSVEIDYMPNLSNRPVDEIAHYPPSLRGKDVHQIVVRDSSQVLIFLP